MRRFDRAIGVRLRARSSKSDEERRGWADDHFMSGMRGGLRGGAALEGRIGRTSHPQTGGPWMSRARTAASKPEGAFLPVCKTGLCCLGELARHRINWHDDLQQDRAPIGRIAWERGGPRTVDLQLQPTDDSTGITQFAHQKLGRLTPIVKAAAHSLHLSPEPEA